MNAVKRSVLGIGIDATTYDEAAENVLRAAHEGRRFTVSALAVHGVITGVQDREHRTRLNRLDLVTPDGQPVRWALWLLHGVRLPDRVYGPTLTLHVCERAARQGVAVYFYGSTQDVLDRLVPNLQARFPGLQVAGSTPSRFRTVDPDEKAAIADEILASGAGIVFVGLGCPRQEVFAYEFGDLLQRPVLAVGAAFDYHAGVRREPPAWMQRSGLQWLHRLAQEPGRLWRRYLATNTLYVVLVALQRLGIWRPSPGVAVDEVSEVGYA